MHIGLSRKAVEDLLFHRPPEQMIAAGRLVLAGVAVIAALIDGAPLAGPSAALWVALAYLAFALTAIGVVLHRALRSLETQIVHTLDILTASTLMYLTEGPVSPFFVLFTFCLMAATLRWRMRGAILTALILIGSFLFVIVSVGANQLTGDGATMALLRSVYLLVLGALFGYVGAVWQRGRRRLAQLVNWPALGGPDAPIAPPLAHAAGIVRAARVLIVWDERSDPSRHVALYSDGKVTVSRERPDRFGSLVEPGLDRQSFAWPLSPDASGDNRAPKSSAGLDHDLRETFGIGTALTAPIRGAVCSGRIFMLDPVTRGTDDLLLTKLVAERMATSLDEGVLRREREEAAALAERVRLGRDIHDGVLQSLTAANLKLKLLSLNAVGDSVTEIERLRALLAEEQRRVRAFVEDTRTGQIRSDLVDVRDDIEARVRSLADQWGCVATVAVDVRRALPTRLAQQIRHLVGEAISNAVRHGSAKSVEVDVAEADGRLDLRIADNGTGFADLKGSYTDQDLRDLGRGPRSILNRVASVSGRLLLETSGAGSTLRIGIPI
ncbi:MAG TPA: histidine kinase [Microvirga sp.]|jgi:signal transduction histidine kinase